MGANDVKNGYRGIEGIKRVAIVGAGLVGADWVACYLSRGLAVNVYGRRTESQKELRERLAVTWPEMEEVDGLAPDADPENWTFSTNLESALEGCDYVQENIAENEALKISMFSRIDAVLPKDVLIASSTSSLSITRLQSQCQFPERCVLGHPFTPTHLLPLVEVVGGKRTDPAAVDAAMRFYRGLGKRPVRLEREIFGHIGNRLASALWREAVYLVKEGVATVEDIDAAVSYGPARKWAVAGPFMSYHLSGGEGGFPGFLEHFGAGQQRRWEQLGVPSLTPETRKLLIERVAESTSARPRPDIESERDSQLVALTKALQGNQ